MTPILWHNVESAICVIWVTLRMSKVVTKVSTGLGWLTMSWSCVWYFYFVSNAIHFQSDFGSWGNWQTAHQGVTLFEIYIFEAWRHPLFPSNWETKKEAHGLGRGTWLSQTNHWSVTSIVNLPDITVSHPSTQCLNVWISDWHFGSKLPWRSNFTKKISREIWSTKVWQVWAFRNLARRVHTRIRRKQMEGSGAEVGARGLPARSSPDPFWHNSAAAQILAQQSLHWSDQPVYGC